MKSVKISKNDRIFIRDEYQEDIGCGSINNDGNLYFINRKTGEALQLADKYKDTPILISPPCGGYQEGLIMVSLLGEINLQYYHTLYGCAGLWGWIDLKGNEVIPPQFVYAMSFFNGRAIVCKGDWSIDEEGLYWCKNEQWGIIDKTGKEIVPCSFDEISEIEGTDRYLLCHEGGWENGHSCIYDMKTQEVVLTVDFYFDTGYMFNECFFDDGRVVFDEHIPGEETDFISIYSLEAKKWLAYHKQYEKRELNGETKIVVNKNGEEIIVF